MLDGREVLRRWGFTVGGKDQGHFFVRTRFSYSSDPDLKAVGYALDVLSQIRGLADYDLRSARFGKATEAVKAINDVTKALTQLDAVDADPARRAAAIADIKSRWKP
jgi:hypothetical protein